MGYQSSPSLALLTSTHVLINYTDTKPDFVLEIYSRSDQWALSINEHAAARLQRVASLWVAWSSRFHSNQFKTTFYPPVIMECRLCLSAQRSASGSCKIDLTKNLSRHPSREKNMNIMKKSRFRRDEKQIMNVLWGISKNCKVWKPDMPLH